MIKVYKYLNEFDFRNEFSGLDNTSWADEWQALGVLYGHLEDLGGDMLAAKISDWLRFEVVEMTAEEIKKNYNNIFEGSNVEDFLNDYTVIYGTYESNGKTYYLFNGEF